MSLVPSVYRSYNARARTGQRVFRSLPRQHASLALLGALALAIVTGCYRDEALRPASDITVFYLDTAGVEREFDFSYMDSVDYRSTLVFRSDATADDVVIWTGDRVVDFSEAALLFRPDSYNQMLDFGVPAEVVEGLRSLEGQEFSRERDLVRAIRRDDLFDIRLYLDNKDAVREAIFIPVSGNAADGTDSIAFQVNHSYSDFLVAEERGFYNVTGAVMRPLPDGDFRYEYGRYPRPGTFTVTASAVGIGDFGRETLAEVDSIQIRLFKLF